MAETPVSIFQQELTDQTCACCGYEYKGNYCPVCGQKSGDGRITWDWVRRSVMLLWGMESHSMFVSLWQLLLRPGYFIKDYLNGRRQVSYPPVKMLFVVLLIYLIFRQLLDMLFPGAPVVESVPEDLSESVIETAHTWITENPGYGMMTMTLILILPTCFFFRYAPRHPRHTFPEGFFYPDFYELADDTYHLHQ